MFVHVLGAKGTAMNMVERLAVSASATQPRVAVLLPCYNEAAAIAQTIDGFRRALPGADIYVYDNNSRTTRCA